MKDKIREICTFHGKDGTSGYLLDEQRFSKIFELLDNQKKAMLDELDEMVVSLNIAYEDIIDLIKKS